MPDCAPGFPVLNQMSVPSLKSLFLEHKGMGSKQLNTKYFYLFFWRPQQEL